MTNREKYKERILDIACKGHSIAIVNGKITECGRTNCTECDFGGSFNCRAKIAKWAYREYVESPIDWSKVPIDTPILVTDSNDKTWKRRYFAKYEDGVVFTFRDGKTSWSAQGDMIYWNYAKLAESEE